MKEIYLENLDKNEALRYMGYRGYKPKDNVINILGQCEEEIIKVAKPRYVYRVVDFNIDIEKNEVKIPDLNLVLGGNSIVNHLEECQKAVLFAATVSSDVDKVIRKSQVEDIFRAVCMDCMGSVAIEQACDKFELMLKDTTPEMFQTFRFGIGYGDLSIELQKKFIKALNAEKTIGLTVSESGMLIPLKSVTAIIGLSDKPIKQKSRGCQTCNMRERCSIRGKGGRCNG